MSQPYEELNDLFDFPEVEGLEDFGLVPPVPSGVAVPDDVTGEVFAAEPTGPVADVGAAPLEAPDAPSPAASGPPIQEARPNPPVPEGIQDLDEDLFQFHELFSLEDDPYHNGTLQANGSPAEDLFVGDPVPVKEREPSPAAEAPAATVPEAAQAPEPPAPLPDPAPQSQAQNQVPAPVPTAGSTDLFNDAASPGQASGDRERHASLGRDRGPRILLPEDVPYSGSFEKDRLLWGLVACFLAFITLIAFATHRASQDFRETLHETTGMLADAMAQRGEVQGFPATSSSIDIGPESGVVHTVEAPKAPLPTAVSPTANSRAPEWIDPRDYASTHEFAVGNAKALLSEGRFEDARRLLNHVLANQARIPLSPTLREEIDYLIPLTYFEQGTATAPLGSTAGRAPRPAKNGEDS